MQVTFTQQELAACLPPPGRYLVEIAQVEALPDTGCIERVALVLRVQKPLGLVRWLHDSIPLRNTPDPRATLDGRRRLLHLLGLAGVHVAAGCPLELRQLIGLELVVEVASGADRGGLRTTWISSYAPWRAPRVPDAGSRHGPAETTPRRVRDTPDRRC